ncbi:MAG: DUF92 domain-containing protein [Candidatus Micrarchaeota archaeon]|nr:DUF92 domain-containing protein [Candidatus Micrarchaeota archaeon]
MLDKQGIAIAVMMAVAIVYFSNANYLLLILVFYALALMVTKYEYKRKKDQGIYEHERSWENVLSNGLVPTMLAVASPYIGSGAFIGAVSAITADKFASELGVFDKTPLSLENLKPVKPGTSGAVSVLGFVVSLMGGCFIGVATMFIFNKTANEAIIIAVIGLAGSVVDSLFGVLEEKGFGTKGTTNMICSITGGLLGYFR